MTHIQKLEKRAIRLEGGRRKREEVLIAVLRRCRREWLNNGDGMRSKMVENWLDQKKN